MTVVVVGASGAGRAELVERLRGVGMRVDPSADADPDLVVVHCPPGATAVARTVERAASRYTVPLVVICEARFEDTEVVDAVAAGAGGWLDAAVPDEALHAVLRDVAGGGVSLSRSHVAVVVAELRRRSERSVRREDGSVVRLAPREWEVLQVLAAGGSTHDAARRLGIGPTAVRGYVASAVKRLRAPDRATAVQLFAAQHVRRPGFPTTRPGESTIHSE